MATDDMVPKNPSFGIMVFMLDRQTILFHKQYFNYLHKIDIQFKYISTFFFNSAYKMLLFYINVAHT